jgi:hypothetical protein
MARTDVDAGPGAGTAPLSRRVCVTVVIVAVVAICIVHPLLSLAIVPAFMPAAYILSYDHEEVATTRPGWWPVTGVVLVGGLAGLIVGAYADQAVAAVLAERAHAAATHGRATSTGFELLGVAFVGSVWTTVLIVVTGVVLAVCRVRRGFFVGLSGGVLSVVVAFAVGSVIVIVPHEFTPAYAVSGAVGYGLAAVVYRPTVPAFVRTAALAVPMLAVAVLARL